MLIDLQYRDDGLRVDVTLITPDEQALSDASIARDVWWPDRMNWVVFPVLALPRNRNLPRIPRFQKWSIQRTPSPLTPDEARQRIRLHNESAPPGAQLSEVALSQIEKSWHESWILARVEFPEGNGAR
jgi:hypothetical protein